MVLLLTRGSNSLAERLFIYLFIIYQKDIFLRCYIPSLFSKSVRFLWIMALAAGLRAPILCDFLGAESDMSRRDVCPCGGHANCSLYSVLNFEMALRSIPLSCECYQ